VIQGERRSAADKHEILNPTVATTKAASERVGCSSHFLGKAVNPFFLHAGAAIQTFAKTRFAFRTFAVGDFRADCVPSFLRLWGNNVARARNRSARSKRESRSAYASRTKAKSIRLEKTAPPSCCSQLPRSLRASKQYTSHPPQGGPPSQKLLLNPALSGAKVAAAEIENGTISRRGHHPIISRGSAGGACGVFRPYAADRSSCECSRFRVKLGRLRG